MMTHHLAGLTEIAAMLGISKQRVDQLVKGSDFPEPEAELAGGRVWSTHAVQDWAKASLRPIDVRGAHIAAPYQLPSGKWIGYCTACGRIGMGRDLDSDTLAHQLVAAHGDIYGNDKPFEFMDSDGQLHHFVSAGDPTTGTVWVPSWLAITEEALRWIRDDPNLRSVADNGMNGEAVFKVPRSKWEERMSTATTEAEA